MTHRISILVYFGTSTNAYGKNNFRYFVDVVLSLNMFNGKITIFFLIGKVSDFCSINFVIPTK